MLETAEWGAPGSQCFLSQLHLPPLYLTFFCKKRLFYQVKCLQLAVLRRRRTETEDVGRV